MEYRKNDSRETIIKELEKYDIDDFDAENHSEKVLKTVLFFAENLSQFNCFISDEFFPDDHKGLSQEELDKLVAVNFRIWGYLDEDELMYGPICEPPVTLKIYVSGKWSIDSFEPVNDFISSQCTINSDCQSEDREDEMLKDAVYFIYGTIMD